MEAESPQDPWIGKEVAGQFRVTAKVGRGGMGAVYRATQLEMDREVVLKVLDSVAWDRREEAIERFRREAKAIARLNHPNIVQIHAVGATGDRDDPNSWYLALEWIDGKTLREVIKAGGPLPPKRALRVLDGVLAALEEAHREGVVHRDLKPDNVMIVERSAGGDIVKVLDFGIARLMQGDDEGDLLTRPGQVFGTPRYMAPEQASGGTIDHRVDIYAAGLLAYEMFTSRPPFRARTPVELLVKHAHEAPPPLSMHAGVHVPHKVERFVLKALEKKPEERYGSAEEMRAALAELLADPDLAGPRPSSGFQPSGTALHPTGRKRGERGPWMWVAIAGAVVLAVALLVAVLRGGGGGADAGAGQGVPISEVEAAPAGPPVEGLDAPAGAVLLASTPQVVTLRVPQEPAAVVAFYWQRYGSQYEGVRQVPNGLMIEDPSAPVVSVGLAWQGTDLLVSLSRNVLGGPVAAPATDAFGVPAPPGARTVLKTPQAVQFEVRAEPRSVQDFYRAHFLGQPGVRILEPSGASDAFTVTGGASAGFGVVTVTPEGGVAKVMVTSPP